MIQLSQLQGVFGTRECVLRGHPDSPVTISYRASTHPEAIEIMQADARRVLRLEETWKQAREGGDRFTSADLEPVLALFARLVVDVVGIEPSWSEASAAERTTLLRLLEGPDLFAILNHALGMLEPAEKKSSSALSSVSTTDPADAPSAKG